MILRVLGSGLLHAVVLDLDMGCLGDGKTFSPAKLFFFLFFFLIFEVKIKKEEILLFFCLYCLLKLLL